MNLSRTLFGVSVFAAAALAMALPAFNKEFKSTYVLKKGGKLEKANCTVCHIGMTHNLNLYGADLKAAMQRENAKTVTGSVLKKVEGLDSDKDGVANKKEIENDTLPGDPKSK